MAVPHASVRLLRCGLLIPAMTVWGLPQPVYEALRETAFKERCKIHDLVMEGIGRALSKRGYPALDDLKAGRKR
jgi:hypothetical protein